MAVMVCFTCQLASAARHRICFEAESAKEIEAPMVLVTNGIAGASGHYLEIPEGAGNPPKVKRGKAVYEVDIPADGAYTLWCRVYWEDECSNSFNVTVDDGKPFLLGDNATYETWHWVKYPVARTMQPLKLTKGKHKLILHNREDGVRVDQILLSSDKRFVPVDIEEIGTKP